VGVSNGADLMDVMATVDKVESAPLMDAERAENNVTDRTARAKEGFGLSEKLIDASQSGDSFVGEFPAREWRRIGGRADWDGGFAAAWEVSECSDHKLTDALL
jgi:hypothetical protein